MQNVWPSNWKRTRTCRLNPFFCHLLRDYRDFGLFILGFRAVNSQLHNRGHTFCLAFAHDRSVFHCRRRFESAIARKSATEIVSYRRVGKKLIGPGHLPSPEAETSSRSLWKSIQSQRRGSYRSPWPPSFFAALARQLPP